MDRPASDRFKAASILIQTYNRKHDLQECLSSLPWEQMDRCDVEVVVLDDGSSDGAADMVRELFPFARLIVNERNLGLIVGRNIIARAAGGDLLIYLDDDAVVEPGWLEAMLAAHDGRTLLGGRIMDYGRDHQQAGASCYTFVGKRIPCPSRFATVGTGANLGIPWSSFLAVNGFDEELQRYGFDESDFCIRAHKAGFGFKYLPHAVVRHKGSKVKKGEAIRMQERNSTYAMLKSYRKRPVMWILFSLANGLWLVLRLLIWSLKGRFHDCALLWNGWISAYLQFLHGPPKKAPD